MKRPAVFTLSFLTAIFLAFSAYGSEKKMTMTIEKTNLKEINSGWMVPAPKQVLEFAKKAFPANSVILNKLSEPNFLIELKGVDKTRLKEMSKLEVEVIMDESNIRMALIRMIK